jgi:hypothetical protein
MTSKEKASELIVDFQLKCKTLDYQEAKQCALIAVDEILKLELQEVYQNSNYWQEVKEEIENL